MANTGLTFEPGGSWAARVLQYDRKTYIIHMIARLHYDFCDCDPDDPNKNGVVEFCANVNSPPVAPFFGAPNKGCAIGAELFAVESLNTLPGVGGTTEEVEPGVPKVNGAFPVSDLGNPVPPKEKRGGAFAPPLGTPNSVAELTDSFGPDCPRLSMPALSLGLISDAVGTAPLMEKPLDFPLPPNVKEDGIDGAIVVLGAFVLEGLVMGCPDGKVELADVPKLKIDFGGLDGAGAAGGLDGEVLGGLLEIPKLNFGFCESLMPPVGGAAELEPLVVVVELEGCGNEKVPRG